MKMRKSALLSVILSVVCIILLVSCPNFTKFLKHINDELFKVRGTVVECPAGKPLVSVEVFVNDYQYSELTNSEGDYEIELPEGKWNLNFVKDNFTSEVVEVNVGPQNPREEITTCLLKTTSELSTIVIADRGNNRIAQIKDMDGNGWTSYGTTGSGTDQFNGPVDLARDSQGRIYISDRWNHRIVRIDDMNGTNWKIFGTSGSLTDQFQYPLGLAIDKYDRIYIGDNHNHRVVRIDNMDGDGWVNYGTNGVGDDEFQYPAGVAVDDSIRIFVADSWNDRIVRVDDLSGAGWKTLGTTGYGINQFIGPVGVAVATGKIYVADHGHQEYDPYDPYRIIRADDMDGTGWTSFGGAGSGVGQFDHPYKITVGPDQRLYIADLNNNRIIRVDNMTGAGWKEYGIEGSGDHQLKTPTSILVY